MNENDTTTRPKPAATTALPLSPREPRVDVFGDEREVRIVADMPGTDENSIEVTLDDGVLVLRGTPAGADADTEGTEQHWTEFSFGPYERSFALPEDLTPDGIRASVKDGVAEVVIPRRVRSKRSIPITVR